MMVTGKAMGLGPGAPRISAEAETPSPLSDEPSDEDGRQARRAEKIRVAGEQNVSGQPFYLVKRSLTAWDGDRPRDASKVGQKVLALIDRFGRKGRFFLFVHFGDEDADGDKYGESSQEYNDALVSLDAWLGRIVAQLKADGLDDHTAIYLTADHGFDVGTTHHNSATHIFLASNDPVDVSRRAKRHRAHRPASPGRGRQQDHPGLAGQVAAQAGIAGAGTGIGSGSGPGSPFGDFGTATHPPHPARFARALASPAVLSPDRARTVEWRSA